MYSSPLHKDPRLPNLYTLFCKKQDHQTRIRDLKKRIQATNDVLQMEELKCRKRVLRRLGFISASDIVDVKGRVACEISTGDELLLTELVFNGAFNTLPPEHCAGLLSCFVFTEKVCSTPRCNGVTFLPPAFSERANNEAEGRVGGAVESDARDCAQDSESFERVETSDR